MNKINVLTIVSLFYIANISAQTTQTDIPWETLAESPWPMISHDPQFTGRSPYKGPQTANVIWTRDYPDGIFSGPVIGESGNLYFGSYYQLDGADNFYSITPTNEDRWIFNTGSNRPPQSGILVDSSNTIYFGSLDKNFYAINPDGTLKWKYETSAIIYEIVVPNIDLEGRLYITNGLGELYSLNQDGTLNWKVEHDDGFFLKSPVFSPDGNTMYIAGSDSGLYALNLDGSIKWKNESLGKIYHLPLVDSDGNIYIIPEEIPQFFYSLDSLGNINWSKKIIPFGTLDTRCSPTLDTNGNIYALLWDSTYVTPRHRALFSFNHNGETNWKYIFELPENSTDDFWQPLICDVEGTIYLGSTFGSYYYAISSEGELKWKMPLNDYQVDNTGAIAEDGTLYIGVHGSSLWNANERNLIAIRDSTPTDIKDYDSNLPDSYKLSQNHPNPFNPSTKIFYHLPENGHVTLKVYDMLGRELTELVNSVKAPGIYEVQFDGSNLASGTYIYQIIVDALGEGKGYSASKKMLLVK